MALFWGYVRKRDNSIKKSLKKNFNGPMLAFPTFPKELLLDLEGDVEAAVTDTTKHPATTKKSNNEIEGEEKKIEVVNIKLVKEGDNMNETSAPQEPATTPQTTAPISE
ncbi:hypothetical protein PVK06_020507 [Gossypium arboreum]|uniref:Uncharacterized protein n=1 Tax=Gossypium arboreum TaxID=29729 RepID=A0ABR0PMJ9_GOSAR|nr:hypothetical protein PVK06_020507 [Gossypium arboreum]